MDDRIRESAKSSGDGPKIGSDQELDKEELRSARDVLLQLTKTAKILKIYLPNNPIYQKFLQELQDRLDIHLQEYETLRFKIRQYEILYGGQVVYENANRVESMAFKLYVDGIREILLLEGVDSDEITSFLDIIGREYDPSGPDDDMVTLLWERHFDHIQYLVADDFIDETVTPMKPPDPAAVGNLMDHEKEAARPVPGSSETPLLDYLGPKLAEQVSQIFVLTEEEISGIKKRMEIEENTNPITILLGILTAILRVETDESAFSEMAGILENVLETLTLRGDFWHSIKILELFRELMDPIRNLPENQKRRLIQAIDRAGEAQRMRELEPVLNQWGSVETDRFLEFGMLLNKNAMIPLIDLLARLTQMKVRRVVCEVLANMGRENIDPLTLRLEDPRWYVVRNMVYILGKIGHEKVVERLRKVVDHKEVKVRKEVIHALEGIKIPTAKELLVGFLNDPDRSLRILAMRSLAKQGYSGALEPLLEMIDDPDFAKKDLHEKKEVFDTLGRIGGEEIIPRMRKLMKKGGSAWFKRAQKEEQGLCAVVALERIGTESAMDILSEGRKFSSKVIREACSNALNKRKRSDA